VIRQIEDMDRRKFWRSGAPDGAMAHDVVASGARRRCQRGGKMRSARVGGRASRTVAGVALAVAVVTAMVTAMVTGATVPAAAGDGGVAVDPWPHTVACATGAFTGHVFREPDTRGTYLELSGWVRPCPGALTGELGLAKFGFAYLREAWSPDKTPMVEGVMHSQRLRLYESADAPTPWSGRLDVRGTGEPRSQATLCLMANRVTRVACVTISLITSGAHPTATINPIPLDDPSVAHQAIVFTPGPRPDPECGACV
jgi:hypothetical protein